MTTKRFYIERDEAATECECPESLCPHEDGHRLYPIWHVIDAQTDEQVHTFDVYKQAMIYRDARNAEHQHLLDHLDGKI